MPYFAATVVVCVPISCPSRLADALTSHLPAIATARRFRRRPVRASVRDASSSHGSLHQSILRRLLATHHSTTRRDRAPRGTLRRTAIASEITLEHLSSLGVCESPRPRPSCRSSDRIAGMLYPVSERVLNHYRLIRPLGAGGMGEVYLAEDTRLKRRGNPNSCRERDEVADEA